MAHLTEQQAYLAMFTFLEHHYRNGAQELGELLGSLALLPDGGSADPAHRTEWLAAVERVLSGKTIASFELSPTKGSRAGT